MHWARCFSKRIINVDKFPSKETYLSESTRSSEEVSSSSNDRLIFTSFRANLRNNIQEIKRKEIKNCSISKTSIVESEISAKCMISVLIVLIAGKRFSRFSFIQDT